MTVGGVLIGLARHPWRLIVLRWNWKAAVLSTMIRGVIFFTTNITGGLEVAARALVTDVAFRLPLVGIYAAIVQAFVGAEPVWAANLVVAGAVPAVAHSVEFAVHRSAGTPALRTGVIVSIAFSILTSVFQLFAMRHGTLIVGAGGTSLATDLRRLPRLGLAFLWEIVGGFRGFGRAPRADR